MGSNRLSPSQWQTWKSDGQGLNATTRRWSLTAATRGTPAAFAMKASAGSGIPYFTEPHVVHKTGMSFDCRSGTRGLPIFFPMTVQIHMIFSHRQFDVRQEDDQRRTHIFVQSEQALSFLS